MKKIILILFLIPVICFSQEYKYKITNYGKANKKMFVISKDLKGKLKIEQVKNIKEMKEKGGQKKKLEAGSVKDTNEIKTEYANTLKLYQEVIKKLEELQADKLRLEGILMYLQEKYKKETETK